MTFNSFEELKRYILSQSRVAIEKARDEMFKKIENVLLEFYEDFTPDVYVRTYQLLCSLVKEDVVSTGDGWRAEIYFDMDALDYSTRIVPQGQPWSAWAKPENTFHREDWTGANTEWVFKTAMTGDLPHGGYAGGDNIWDETKRVFNSEKLKVLKQALKKAGIPIR